MSKMKDSGIQWIGKIPSHWIVNRLRYNCNFKTGGTPPDKCGINDKEDGYPWITAPDMSDGYVIKNYNQYISKYAVRICNYKLFPKHSILLVCIASVGKIGYTLEETYSNQQITALMPKKNCFSKYLLYLMSAYSDELVKDASNSVVPIVNTQYLLNISCCIPKMQEQKLIADFLDEKIDIIDKIIGDLNNQIEILNKYKKQIITETVTSGLNKNAKFKDSGIDWMGEIPEHWEIKRLKYLGSARNGLTYEPEDQCDEGMLVLRSSNIQDGKLCLDDNVYVNMKVPKNIILKRNDLLICSRNGSRNLIGKNILIEDSIEGNTYGAFMCVFRSEYNKYIHYVLNSNIFDHYLNTFLTSTINQLTNSNLYSIKIAIPMDIKEQQEIVKYLDDRCQKIDEILNSKIKQKKQMEQYKKSVIYEYVTGKKRVEGAEELYG